MKPLNEWISSCKDEVLAKRMRKEVLAQNVDIESRYHSLAQAIGTFIDWGSSEFGVEYWENAHDEALGHEMEDVFELEDSFDDDDDDDYLDD